MAVAANLTGEISPGRRGAAHPHCDSRTSGLDPSQRLDFPASYTAVRQLKARQNYSGTRLRISPPKSPPAASRRSEPPIRSSRQKPLTPPTHQGFFVVRSSEGQSWGDGHPGLTGGLRCESLGAILAQGGSGSLRLYNHYLHRLHRRRSHPAIKAESTWVSSVSD